MDSFLMPFIQATLALDPAELAHKSESGYTFLHALAQFTRDPQVLRDQLSAILIAGRDTTAAAMSWTFFQFARHPEVVKKLRQEILDTCGTDQTPSYENLKNMKYLQVK
jgi:cytochrome P450